MLGPIPTLTRRRFVGAATAGLLAAPLAAAAQPAAKLPRVAVLWASAEPLVRPYRMALEAGLRDRGWGAGRNVTLEHRYPESPEAVPGAAAELVRLRPDVIVAVTNQVIAEVRRVTATVPIVMLYAATPVESGFVKTMARPGTNLTGLSFDPTPELLAKDLELFKEAVPRATRVGILWNPRLYEMSAATRQYVEVIRTAGQRLALTLRFLPVTSLQDVEALFPGIDGERLDGMFVVPDAFVTFQHHRRIAELTARRFPTVHVYREHTDAGGLLSYGPSIIAMPRQLAAYVDKILKGARPADLPVEQPSTFELVINLKTARALGLTIPPSLLLRADHVIE